ncbi:MAG: VWA domain-containing protein [Methanobrevibacter sp.]|uniref:vWA domain-containing protein n=1 Tax=Methanobrevibacter sp. TaxID=66852 RepID=UPI001B55509C|nr:vWA domain-containing protein [Methanobrevibacter sp.]MBP3791427.1 VWA domain-containing protein [Methanobrevibacter sp.]
MKIESQEEMDLIFIMDRSGSMCGSEKDTIGGFNSFIQKELKKELNTRVTVVLFDHEYEVLYKRKPIHEVPELTDNEYWVRGSTALLDAIGRTINSLDKEINNKALVVIMTDGYENSSCEYTKEQIRNLISNHSWEFLYIGADIDSYSEAANFGFRKSRVANYQKSKIGVEEMYTSVSDARDCMLMDVELDDGNWKENLKKYD